ncbi:MAG: ABC transporter ATP-binding protein [Eubacteriales bacterium]
MSGFNEEEYSGKKVDIGMWRKLLKSARPFYRYMGYVAIFMSFAAMMDVINPFIMSHLIDNNLVKQSWEGALPWMALYLLVGLSQIVNVYGFIRNACKVENGLTNHIRRLAFDKLQTLSFSYYDKMPVGFIMSRLTSDAQRLSDTLAWSMVDLVWSALFMVAAAVAMLLYNWKLALMVIAITPVIAVVSVLFRMFILKANREVRKTNSKITGAYNEGISGAKTTKTLVREELNLKDFTCLSREMRGHSVHAAVLSSLFMPIVMTLGSVGTSLILWQGGVQYIFGSITLGEMNFFMTLGGFFFEPINNLARIFAELQSAQAAVERVVTLLDTQPEIQDDASVTQVYGDEFAPKRENWPDIRGEVEFKNVSFKYKDGQTVLKSFNLKIKPGERIALVGETGSGKSTIVNLICRFYEPTQGVITIDGTDYRERSQLWLHSNLGYVLQTPHLFSGTICENIRYGRLDASDEEVERVAKLVDAHPFIMKLEKGYDTQVGEGGGRLSTGEKQLISFARAIIADPALFVLDEATSSIDTETEQVIQSAIEKVLHGRTSFIIAHRLSTIRTADRILVIKDGEVAQQGTHSQLMRQGGIYRSLYTTQFREEKASRVLGRPLAEEEEAG